MRKILSLVLSVLIVLAFSACSKKADNLPPKDAEEVSVNTNTDNYVYKDVYVKENDPNNPTTLGFFYRNTIGADISSRTEAERESDKKADAKLAEIENMPDTLTVGEGGRVYYLSNEGNDKNDGLTPETARCNFYAVKSFLKSGDLILFRRGDLFRTNLVIPEGVSVGAYGEGIKPRIYGSIDGRAKKWVKTAIKDVYRYTGAVSQYSNIVFNNGQYLGSPVVDINRIKDMELNVYYNNGIYLYSPDGNPAEVFYSIEIVSAINSSLVKLKGDNIKLQNLCIMYTGRHAINGGGIKNIKVEGCLIGFCGGEFLPQGKTSIGNGIEFWNEVENAYITNNYLFQCYDAALTHQGPAHQKTPTDVGVNYTNIHYEDNLIEYCTYDFEAFTIWEQAEFDLSPNAEWGYNDVYIRNNICRFNGYGWGSLVRPGGPYYANFKYGVEVRCPHNKPLIIENNIFDRSLNHVIGGMGNNVPKDPNLILKNNTFIQRKDVCVFAEIKFNNPIYERVLNNYFGVYEGNKFIIID